MSEARTVNDLRYALRRLARRPSFTIVAVLTLALGIGVNTAIFSVIDAVLLRPLPYEDPDRVVRLIPEHPQYGESDLTFSYPDLMDLRAAADAFEGIAAQAPWNPHLRLPEGAVGLRGASVNADYFRVLGVRPAVGRFFRADEAEPGSANAVVLSHELWVGRFGADPDVVGSEIRLGEASYTVVGVTRADFEDPRLDRGSGGWEAPQIWGSPPAYWIRDQFAEPGTRFLTAVARLGPGVTLARAQAVASTVMDRLRVAYPDSHAGWGIRLVPLEERIVGPVRPTLLALGFAVGLVLLIACANLANLLLARGIGRRGEIAVRVALGGSAWRIVRLVLVESVVLALAGGALGLGLMWLGADTIVALGMGRLPRLAAIGVDARILAFTAGLSLLTALVFGCVPARRAARVDVRAGLQAGGSGGGGRRQARLRRALVTGEVALTVVLLAGAGLLLRSLWSLYAVEAGVQAEGALTMQVSPPFSGYETDEWVHALYDRS
ncbi:MAG: ABC transporter permease, partial [Gemmatimonadota bacterium]